MFVEITSSSTIEGKKYLPIFSVCDLGNCIVYLRFLKCKNDFIYYFEVIVLVS